MDHIGTLRSTEVDKKNHLRNADYCVVDCSVVDLDLKNSGGKSMRLSYLTPILINNKVNITLKQHSMSTDRQVTEKLLID